MAGYVVDVDALDELRSKLQAYLTHSENALHRVESLIGQVAGSWDGTASETYQRRHREWVQVLREMHTALDDFTAWSAEGEDAYRTVMAMNLRMAGQ